MYNLWSGLICTVLGLLGNLSFPFHLSFSTDLNFFPLTLVHIEIYLIFFCSVPPNNGKGILFCSEKWLNMKNVWNKRISFILENSFEYLFEAVYWYAAISCEWENKRSEMKMVIWSLTVMKHSINFNTLLAKNAPGTIFIESQRKIDINFSIDLVKIIHHSSLERKSWVWPTKSSIRNSLPLQDR